MFNDYLYKRTISDINTYIDDKALITHFSKSKKLANLKKQSQKHPALDNLVYQSNYDGARVLALHALASKVSNHLDTLMKANLKPLHKVIKNFQTNIFGSYMSTSKAIDNIAYVSANVPSKLILTNSLIWNLVNNFKRNLYKHKHIYLLHINDLLDYTTAYLKYGYNHDYFVQSLGLKLNQSLHHQYKLWNNTNVKKHDYPYVLVKVDKKHHKAKLENISKNVRDSLINYLNTHMYSDSKRYFEHLVKFALGSDTMFYTHKSKPRKRKYAYHMNYAKASN